MIWQTPNKAHNYYNWAEEDDVAKYDPGLVYGRVMCLQKVRGINMKDVLSYELASAPPSMFDTAEEMRITKSKSSMTTKL